MVLCYSHRKSLRHVPCLAGLQCDFPTLPSMEKFYSLSLKVGGHYDCIGQQNQAAWHSQKSTPGFKSTISLHFLTLGTFIHGVICFRHQYHDGTRLNYMKRSVVSFSVKMPCLQLTRTNMCQHVVEPSTQKNFQRLLPLLSTKCSLKNTKWVHTGKLSQQQQQQNY